MMNSDDPDYLDPLDQGGSRKRRGRPGEQEGLRLIQAFRAIPDPKVRRTVIELVENISRCVAKRSRDL